MGQKTQKLFERAQINLRKNNHENALRLFNEVLNREPGHAQALRNKGLIKVLNAEKNEAEQFLLYALEQKPADAQLLQMLGTLYYNNGDPKKARTFLIRATNIDEKNYLAHQGLGMLYAYYFGNHKKAVHHFTKALQNESPSVEIYFNRGCSHIILENMSAAKNDLRKAANHNHQEAQKLLHKYFK